jgi:hypothetical protein
MAKQLSKTPVSNKKLKKCVAGVGKENDRGISRRKHEVIFCRTEKI